MTSSDSDSDSDNDEREVGVIFRAYQGKAP